MRDCSRAASVRAWSPAGSAVPQEGDYQPLLPRDFKYQHSDSSDSCSSMFLRSPWSSCTSLPTRTGEYLPVPTLLCVCRRWELAWKNPLTKCPPFLQGPRWAFGPAAFLPCCWLTPRYCRVACLCQAGCCSLLNILLLQARCLAAIAVGWFRSRISTAVLGGCGENSDPTEQHSCLESSCFGQYVAVPLFANPVPWDCLMSLRCQWSDRDSGKWALVADCTGSVLAESEISSDTKPGHSSWGCWDWPGLGLSNWRGRRVNHAVWGSESLITCSHCREVPGMSESGSEPNTALHSWRLTLISVTCHQISWY